MTHLADIGQLPDRRLRHPQEDCVPPRFYQLAEVAEMLSISPRQALAMVHTGELLGIQVGGRGQWRVEASELEDYIQRKYAETREMIRSRAAEESTKDA
jgi:excisionase family DNA binding protein